jgi:hypothetical protein
MIKLTEKFPFIKIVTIPKIVGYESVIVNEKQLSDEEKKQLKEAKEILSLHQIPLNKVRFTFDIKFTYDVTNNIVNPRYVKLIPKKKTKYNQSIDIDAPTELMTILVGTYQTDYDDFKNVREIIRKSKKGVVISLNDLGTGKIGLDYSILMANLDAAINFHNNII